MLGRDARAGVGDADPARAIGLAAELHPDLATRRRVAHGIVDQVGQRALQLVARACQLIVARLRVRIWKEQLQRLVALFGNHACQTMGVFLTALEQAADADPFVEAGGRIAFQA